MYIIKSEGTAAIKESLQIRDDDFRLLVSCPAKALKKNLQNLQIAPQKIEELMKITAESPEGKIIKI